MNNHFQFLLLGFYLTFFSLSCTEKEQTIKAEYRDVTEAVYSTAIVQPKKVYNVFPSTSGIIEELQIEEGDVVKKGQLLFVISNDKSTVDIQNAQLNYENAREAFKGESAKLNEMLEQIKSATARMKNDSINYERQKRLWEQNVGSRQEYERRKLTYELSSNELTSLKTLYNRSAKELERQMELAKNTVKIRQMNNDDYRVRSKIDGMVYSVQKEVGESVSPQSIVAVIGSQSDFILTLLIDETDIGKVYAGQRVVVVLDAYPGQTYEARVTKIYPEKNERSLTFQIEAEFIESPERLLKGLSGEANIIIRKKENILTLPSQYISEKGEVNTNDGLKPVTIGLKSLEYTEIVSGIDSSTIIKNLE